MGQTVLVTGGAGYVGSVVCEHLLHAGHAVICLDTLAHGQAGPLHLCAHPAFEFVRGDARDEAALNPLLARCDAIFPLAALVGAPACDRDPALATSLNLEAIRLLERLRSRQQLVVYPTTNSGYGTRSGAVECDEETPLDPISHYGRTKVAAEALLLDAPNTISLRFATVFGSSPRMRLDLLVNHFVYAAVTDGYLVIFEKDFRRNFIHVRDAADAFLHCLAHAERMVGRAYNAGLDEANLSKEALALEVQKQVPGFYLHFAPIGADPDKRDYLVSNRRLRQAGFVARRSLQDGIRELIRCYRMLPRGPLENV